MTRNVGEVIQKMGKIPRTNPTYQLAPPPPPTKDSPEEDKVLKQTKYFL